MTRLISFAERMPMKVVLKFGNKSQTQTPWFMADEERSCSPHRWCKRSRNKLRLTSFGMNPTAEPLSSNCKRQTHTAENFKEGGSNQLMRAVAQWVDNLRCLPAKLLFFSRVLAPVNRTGLRWWVMYAVVRKPNVVWLYANERLVQVLATGSPQNALISEFNATTRSRAGIADF